MVLDAVIQAKLVFVRQLGLRLGKIRHQGPESFAKATSCTAPRAPPYHNSHLATEIANCVSLQLHTQLHARMQHTT